MVQGSYVDFDVMTPKFDRHGEFKQFLANEWTNSRQFVLENAYQFRPELIVPILIYCLGIGAVRPQLILAHLAKLRDRRAVEHIIKFMENAPKKGQERSYCRDALTALTSNSFVFGGANPSKWRDWWGKNKANFLSADMSQAKQDELLERLAILRAQG